MSWGEIEVPEGSVTDTGPRRSEGSSVPSPSSDSDLYVEVLSCLGPTPTRVSFWFSSGFRFQTVGPTHPPSPVEILKRQV